MAPRSLEDDTTKLTAEIQAGLAALKLTAPPETAARFALYLTELRRWNERYGFIKAGTGELVRLHLLDALSGLALLKARAPAGTILDFGSGAGFPGLPLAVLMPERRFVLCERKTTERAFLGNMTALLNLRHAAVTDDIRTQAPASLAAVVFRAVTSLKKIHSQVRKYLAPDGILFAYKGKREKIDEEIEEIKPLGLLAEVHTLSLPGEERERHIALVTNAAT